MRNIVILNSLHFSYPLPILMRVSYNTLIVKKNTSDYYKYTKIQRFTPRNPKSTYSQANKERLKWLLENKMIHPKFEDKTRSILSEPFIFPNDIIDKLKEDKVVWKNYQPFSEAYKRIRIAYIEAARKRPEEFEKRLNNFISKTKENKTIIGFGGIEKYY